MTTLKTRHLFTEMLPIFYQNDLAFVEVLCDICTGVIVFWLIITTQAGFYACPPGAMIYAGIYQSISGLMGCKNFEQFRGGS